MWLCSRIWSRCWRLIALSGSIVAIAAWSCGVIGMSKRQVGGRLDGVTATILGDVKLLLISIQRWS